MTDYAEISGKDAIRICRVLPGPLARVWAYLVEPEKRSRWCCGGTLELKVGGTVEMHFNLAALADSPDVAPPEKHRGHPDKLEFSGKVLACQPMHLLRHTWEYPGGYTELQFELKEQGDAVLLTLTQTRLVDHADKVNTSVGWHTYLDIFEDELLGRARRPFWKRLSELDIEYTARMSE